MPTILTGGALPIIRHTSGIRDPLRTVRRAYPPGVEVLFERLSHLDSQSAGAIRVVMVYDTLMRRRVDLPALARTSAGLAECVVGIRLHGTGRVIRTSPDGSPAPVPAPGPSTSAPITLDDEEIGTAWLERPGEPGPLDEVVLDRLAIAAAAVVERYGPARTTMADPALVELVIGADTDEAARSRALRLLGFAADLPIRVVAVRSPGGSGAVPLDRVGSAVCKARPVKAAPLADVGVILATTVEAAWFPAGVRAGIGAAESPDRSWREARTALRFTTDQHPVVQYADLGALAMLAQVPPQVVRDNVDVAAIGRISGSPDDLTTLDTYCAAGSLRRAAELLHLHHSSVSRRLEQIGKALDIDLTEPAGIVRARMALTAWRLLQA
jgi:hypothetical protein